MSENRQQTVWGMVRIPLMPGGEAGWCYYSEDIEHGLSDGILKVDVALEQPDGGRIYGDTSPFEDSEYTSPALQASIGALLSPDKKSFRIGVKLLADTEQKEAIVYWQASCIQKSDADRLPNANEKVLVDFYMSGRDRAETESAEKEESIAAEDFYIVSAPRYLYRGQKFMFACHLPGEEQGNVNWKVIGENGGTIDGYGMYTAPDHQGVFQIEASIGEPAKYRTTVYVMVKE